ncbi:MAG: hypothetical protein ABGX00_13310 [Allomuricauda sp.]
MDRENVQKALEHFKTKVIADSKRNFLGKSASGKGLRSLGGDLKTYPRSFDLDFFMLDYMKYQDKGVSGTKKKYNTPYGYKDKRPPASAFDKWSIRRGLAPRDGEGRFKPRKSLNHAIAESVFRYGIKPSLFFTKAFEKHFKNLPDEVVEAFGLDAEDLMRMTLDAK